MSSTETVLGPVAEAIAAGELPGRGVALFQLSLQPGLFVLPHRVVGSLAFRCRIGGAANDGLMGNDGTTSMCSSWYAEVRARGGDGQEARFFFEKMFGYANHLGVDAEEPGSHGPHLGNFPRAFTHLALISASYAIDRTLSDGGWIG